MSERQTEAIDTSLQTYIDAAPFGVHRYRSTPDGRLRLAGSNAAASRILGVELAAGAEIAAALPGFAGSPVIETLCRLARDGGSIVEDRLLYDDGRGPRYIEMRAYSAAPGTVEVTFTDVSLRVQTERDLREKTDELSRYFTLSLDLLCIVDERGTFKRVNPRWEETFGWKLGEILGRSLAEFVHPDDMQASRVAARVLLEQGVLPVLVNRFRCRDGSYRWTEWRAARHEDTCYAVARDVTDRVKLRESIAERDVRLASIFRAAPVGIGVSVHRVVVEANDHLCELSGYSREELIGLPSRRFYADAEEYRRTGDLLFKEETTLGAGSTETRWVRKDGTLFDVYMGTAPIDPGDLSQGVTFTVLDITQRKRAEADRHALETRMLQTQKLESLGVLAGGIAHDFNNILMAVLGHADLAKAQLPPVSPAMDSLEEIVRAARRAADLCRQMLAYSGKGRFVIQALDLNEVIREMEHMLQVSISKKAVLRFTFTSHLPAVEADVAQIRQIVMNLVINASEALEDANGIINIATGVHDCDTAYLRGASLDQDLAPGRYVFLEVSDNGKGMSPSTQRRIFEPFFTTKFTGRGLGLAAVHGIVRGHKGAVKVYSEEGKGSALKVLFPACGASLSSRDAAAAPAAARWKGKGTVLLADDEESVRAIGRQMLERLGFSVVLAADGRQAVDAFVAHKDELACVIMDLTMPRMDGEEAFREIRRIDPSSKVLLSSGYNEQEAVQRFVGRGLAGFLQKPYQLSMLEEKLRTLVDPG